MAKKKFSILDLNEYGQATVLRGFANQIDKLSLPRIEQVKRLAVDVGLVILTQEEANLLAETQQVMTKQISETLELCSDIVTTDQDMIQRIKLAVSHPEWTSEMKLNKIRAILLEIAVEC